MNILNQSINLVYDRNANESEMIMPLKTATAQVVDQQGEPSSDKHYKNTTSPNSLEKAKQRKINRILARDLIIAENAVNESLRKQLKQTSTAVVSHADKN